MQLIRCFPAKGSSLVGGHQTIARTRDRGISQPIGTRDAAPLGQRSDSSRCLDRLRRPARSGFRLHRARSQHFLPSRCQSYVQTCRLGAESHRASQRQNSRTGAGWSDGRHEKDQGKGKVILLSCKKHRYRQTPRSLQVSAPIGQTADAPSGRNMRKIECKAVASHALEYPTRRRSNHLARMALLARRCSFYPRTYDENWQDTLLPCSAGNLHQKRKGRQGQGIRPCFSARTHKRQLSICPSFDIARDAKQAFLRALAASSYFESMRRYLARASYNQQQPTKGIGVAPTNTNS